MRKLKLASLRRKNAEAFSLIEVTLAIGICAFAMISMVALLPMGLKLNGELDDSARSVSIAGAIAADRLSSLLNTPSLTYRTPALLDSSGKPVPLSEFSFYVTETGEHTTTPSEARYKATLQYIPVSNVDFKPPFYIALRISWPALAANPTGNFETIITIPQR